MRREWRGKSLVELAVMEAPKGAEVVVSTDYDLDELSLPPNAIYVARPARLCGPKVPMLDVLRHLGHRFSWAQPDAVILLQPSSFTYPDIIRIGPALNDLSRPQVSAWRVPDRWNPAYAMDPDHVTAPPTTRQRLTRRYRPNGRFYVMAGDTARFGSLWLDDPLFVECDCFNIDTQADWDEAQEAYHG